MYFMNILGYYEQRPKSFNFREVQNFIFSLEAGKFSALVIEITWC